MKDASTAKSRMGDTAAERQQLAIVMACDTLCAAVNPESMDRVHEARDRTEDSKSFVLPGVELLVIQGGGLNVPVVAGAVRIRADQALHSPACPVTAGPADHRTRRDDGG